MNDLLTIAALAGVGYLLWDRARKKGTPSAGGEDDDPIVEPTPVPPIPSLSDFDDEPASSPLPTWQPHTPQPQTQEPATAHIGETDPLDPATEPFQAVYSRKFSL